MMTCEENEQEKKKEKKKRETVYFNLAKKSLAESGAPALQRRMK